MNNFVKQEMERAAAYQDALKRLKRAQAQPPSALKRLEISLLRLEFFIISGNVHHDLK